ncbi:selenocysteine insertion sequence-binding protein 2 isoform X11 [Sagmatias obliquidens]|uniref:selenocysteine insertion sequence-binding protein 2 isoform X11 n=1 Tax=Sagmatias obliquidens TaxID=3371155 RepID=UPI000F441C22|nr:selenocysteine insertion sequence-binding protein 2 isoform X11 [Lagenorhynchus obliquidens]XP_030688380.1 selenocysteine insertion sequence-binding protein 2 isoform X11 [Globicephala melas]
MASEGPREPAGEGIKLSADVKPFVPKFAGLSVAWSEPSEARVFPSCAATTYYPCVQELAVPEFELVEMEEHELPISSRQKLYAEDMAFGASTFPPQYLSPEIPLHPYAYSPYTLESSQNVCPVPGSQYDYNQPGCFGGFQTVKPRNEHVCPLPQDTKALFKKKTCDEQKFDTKKTDGPISSDLKSVKSSPRMSIHAENSLKSDGYYKRTDRKSRIIEKSGSASKPEFEFTRLDFPELQGRENSEIPEIQKQLKWGPLRSASTDVSLLREVGKPAAVLAEGETVVKNNNRTGSVTDNAATSPSSCTRELSWTPMGYVVRQTLSTELSPAPKNVTSMINLKMVASSADPKNGSMSSSEVLSSEPSYKEKHVVHPTKKSRASQGDDPEQNEASRKNKKKKEKSKSKYEVLTVQEPPRIEDAEEFPNLAVASERRDRVESPKFQSKQQPQNNFKSSGKKSQIPVQLDLGGMLTALEKKQHSQNAKQSSKPVVFSVGAVPVLSKDSMSGKKGHRFGQVKTPHNPLDSSAPLMKKGKQREVPKAKKPTSLKKIILKERQERKQQRLQENAVSPAFASDDVQDGESGGDDQALGQPDPSGGLDDTLHTIIDYACEQNIPFVFALNRKALGRSLNKAVPVSVVGIFSYDGAQDQFHKMVELTMAARQAYRTMLENAHWELPGEPGPLAPASPPTQGPSCSAENRPLAPAGKEEPHYIEIWRNHLEAYTRRALELEESLEASTSQMMNLNL